MRRVLGVAAGIVLAVAATTPTLGVDPRTGASIGPAAREDEPPALAIRGHALTESGRGAPGLRFLACEVTFAEGSGHCGGQMMPTAADGAFVVDELVPGDYHLSVIGPGGMGWGYYQDGELAWFEEDASTIRVLDRDVTVEFVMTDHYLVEGRITDATGAPVPRVDVAFLSDVTYTEHALTDGDGRYAIPLSAGQWKAIACFECETYLPAWHPADATWGYGSTQFTVVGDIAGIDIALERAALIRVTATGSKYLFIATACAKRTCAQFGDPGFAAADPGETATIRAPSGTYAVLMAGDATTLPGYIGPKGITPYLSRATRFSVTPEAPAAVTVALRTIGAGVHPGTTRTGDFPRTATVARGTRVTVRFTLGAGFAGSIVTVLVAEPASSGRLGQFRSAAIVTVGADGNAYWTTTASRTCAFRARYAFPAALRAVVGSQSWTGVLGSVAKVTVR